MGTVIRRLRPAGVQRFRDFLAQARDGSSLAPPSSMLEDPEWSEPVDVVLTVEPTAFATKMNAAHYLVEKLAPLAGHVDGDIGLWSWLALFFFDQICPASGGTFHPDRDEYYVLTSDFRTAYRHKLAGPYGFLLAHRENARLALAAPVAVHGDWAEQLSSNLKLFRNPGFMDAADQLYWDPAKNEPKPGGTNRNRPGNVRRLLAVCEQLSLTYDVGGMPASAFLSVLPQEFERWRSPAPVSHKPATGKRKPSRQRIGGSGKASGSDA